MMTQKRRLALDQACKLHVELFWDTVTLNGSSQSYLTFLYVFLLHEICAEIFFPIFSFTTNSKTLILFSYCCNLHNKFLLRSILGYHLPKLNLRMRRHCTLDRRGMFGQPQTLQGMDLNHRTGKLVRIYCYRYS